MEAFARQSKFSPEVRERTIGINPAIRKGCASAPETSAQVPSESGARSSVRNTHRDGWINVFLDELLVSRKLHIRDDEKDREGEEANERDERRERQTCRILSRCPGLPPRRRGH
jgi:hypothetical protein